MKLNSETIITLWQNFAKMGEHYGVDPGVFAALYVAHHPLFWGTMAWLGVRAKHKRSVTTQVILGVIFWTMPYAYVLAFGHGLPIWAYAIAGIVMGFGGQHAYKEIRKRIKTPETAS